MGLKRFEVYFVNLDPTIGSEIKKIRPCVIISPEELNDTLNTIIVAPLTSTIRNYPTRVHCFVGGKNGQVAIDQLRAIDKIRLNKKVATLDIKTSNLIIDSLQELFS